MYFFLNQFRFSQLIMLFRFDFDMIKLESLDEHTYINYNESQFFLRFNLSDNKNKYNWQGNLL